MERMRLGHAVVEMHLSGLTVTRTTAGEVPAMPECTPYQAASAKALGYGDDLARASREHELAHSLLAVLLGLPESPTLHGVARGRHWQHWRAEEAAALALQRFARMAGVDLVARARALDGTG